MIAENVSTRVEILPKFKLTSNMSNKMKFIGEMVNKMKRMVK